MALIGALYFRDTVPTVFPSTRDIGQTVRYLTKTTMPALIPKAFTEHNQAFVWVCSDCNMLFATRQLPNGYPASDVRRINGDFAQHSQRRHPGTVVVLLQELGEPEPAPSLMQSLRAWVRTA